MLMVVWSWQAEVPPLAAPHNSCRYGWHIPQSNPVKGCVVSCLRLVAGSWQMRTTNEAFAENVAATVPDASTRADASTEVDDVAAYVANAVAISATIADNVASAATVADDVADTGAAADGWAKVLDEGVERMWQCHIECLDEGKGLGSAARRSLTRSST